MKTDREVLEWVRRRIDAFVEYMETHHPEDPRAQALFEKLSDVRLLDPDESVPSGGSWKNGKFKHSTGVLYLAPRDQHGTVRSESSLTKTIVHELAHATRYKEQGEASHSPQWKQTWLWFLEIATQQLGWVVDIKCAECSFYGLCEQGQCPKCNWLQNLCKPYTGKPK